MTETGQDLQDQLKSKKNGRIHTIDYLKGVSMIMIWYCHLQWAWYGCKFIGLIQWTFLDFFGAAGFTFFSVIGTMASCERRWANGNKKVITKKMLLRSSYLLIIGELINLYSAYYLGFYHVFIWNVITAIAVFQLLTPLFMKTPKVIRLALICFIMIIYYPLLNWTSGGFIEAGIHPSHVQISDLSDPRILIYFLFLHHGMMAPFLSYVMIPLITTIVMEGFSEAYKNPDKKVIKRKLNQYGVLGVLLIVLAVTTGFPRVIGKVGEGMIREFPVPLFFISDYPQNMLYMMGNLFILLWFAGYIQIVKQKSFPAEKWVSSMGRLSLSAFMSSHIAFIVPIKNISLLLFYIIFIPVIILVVAGFHYWETKYKAVGTLEWFGSAYGGLILKLSGGLKDKKSLDGKTQQHAT